MIKIAHCFFEQSGTFKNEFIKLGVNAYDYDIKNDFGQTDYKVDLFSEIEKAYSKQESIFDNISKDDIIMAFFPCTLFQENNALFFKGISYQQRDKSDIEKLEYVLERHSTLNTFYCLLVKLMLVCLWGGQRLVVENPYTQPHYLTLYFPIKPAIIDKDRTKNGDYYKKPTQYFFINMKPKDKLVFEAYEYVKPENIERAHEFDMDFSRQVKRSLIHPQYARRFILNYLF